MINRPVWLLAVSLVMASLIAQVAIAQDSVSRMTKEELKARLDDSSLVIIDARSSRDWDASDRKIKGAVRVEPRDASKLPETYSKDQTLVFYCAWAREQTSARVAQYLLSQGYANVYALKGGWDDWLTAGFPVESK